MVSPLRIWRFLCVWNRRSYAEHCIDVVQCTLGPSVGRSTHAMPRRRPARFDTTGYTVALGMPVRARAGAVVALLPWETARQKGGEQAEQARCATNASA